jgi:SAM-dependent methyltransferase
MAMETKPQLSEQEILERMYEHINAAAKSWPADAPPLSSPATDTGDCDLRRLQQEIGVVRALQAEVGTVNPRGPGLHNDAIQVLKRGMARSLSWYTRSLRQFQAAVAGALQEQLRLLTALLQNVITRLDTRVDELYARSDEVHAMRIDERLRSLELKLRRMDSQGVPPSRHDDATVESLPAQSSHSDGDLDFDYFLFQEYHRGNEALIKKRQENYIEYFRGRSPVWDLGCGRGEFLELLREHGITSQGVDTNSDAVQLCLEKGLPVTKGDIFEFLDKAGDASLGGIFSAQVIEHLPVELQFCLVELCGRKLKPGSPLVLETINPECVFALVRNFYLDPTHIRPVHPELLKFLLQSKGFRDVQLSFSGPVEGKYLENPSWAGDPKLQEMGRTLANLNNFVFGFQDYAAIAWRQ